MIFKQSLIFRYGVFFTLAASFTLTVASPAQAITGVDEFSDFDNEHWAAPAAENVIDKHQLMQGYPDKTLRGNKAMSRYEMIAVLNVLLAQLSQDINQKSDKEDVKQVQALQEQLKNTLSMLDSRTGALENDSQIFASKNHEQDTRLSLLEKTSLHGDFSIGLLSDISDQGTGSGKDGIRDAISSIGRARLALDIPIIEDDKNSTLGEGTFHTRLVAAFGRARPSGAQENNAGGFTSFSPASAIAGDASSSNEGLFQGEGGSSLRTSPMMEYAYYSQKFKSALPLKLCGQVQVERDHESTSSISVGLIRWFDFFNTSPYRANELTQFQNVALRLNTGIPMNRIMPMAIYQWHKGFGENLLVDLKAGVGALDVGDAMDGFNASYEARVNYRTAFLGENFTKPGALYAGGYHLLQAGSRNYVDLTSSTNRAGGSLGAVDNSKPGHGFYTGWDQEWYKGIGTHVEYVLNSSSPNFLFLGSPGNSIAAAARQSLVSTLIIPMSAIQTKWRPNDAFGVGYAMIDLQESGINSNTFSDAAEQVIEGFYRFQVTPAITFVPSVQVINNRLGLNANNGEFLMGARINYSF